MRIVNAKELAKIRDETVVARILKDWEEKILRANESGYTYTNICTDRRSNSHEKALKILENSGYHLDADPVWHSFIQVSWE